MPLEEMMRNERKAGFREVWETCILDGRQSILAILKTKSEVAPELCSRIESQGGLEKLFRWLLLAAVAGFAGRLYEKAVRT